MLFGGLLAFGTLLTLALSLGRSPEFAEDIWSAHTLEVLLFALAGGIWVACGVFIWKRKCWRAASCLLLGYASGCLGGWLLMHERWPA